MILYTQILMDKYHKLQTAPALLPATKDIFYIPLNDTWVGSSLLNSLFTVFEERGRKKTEDIIVTLMLNRNK